jgi:hypothetical protein
MALFFRQRKTGRIYHDQRRLHSDPDMFPVYGEFVDGVFVENDPRNEMVAQIQAMDDEEEIRAMIRKKFNIEVKGDLKMVKIRALELVRRWEALVARINDLTEDQVENEYSDNKDPIVQKVLDGDQAQKSDKKEAPRANFEELDVNKWNEAECKKTLKEEFKVDLRKLSHKGVEDLRDLVKDLRRHQGGKP